VYMNLTSNNIEFKANIDTTGLVSGGTGSVYNTSTHTDFTITGTAQN
jgi:hypothetical protein